MTARALGGRYRLEQKIGEGGMAEVYRAMDTLLDRTVAVKMLRNQYAEDEEFVRRFRQEAQAAARLSHPNIVNVYDVGVEDGQQYIVMEYVDGPTLKDVIVERAPLPVEEVIRISRQICSALQHAHELHVVHRDIKPHNILMTKSGQVKVADFGIARAATGQTIAHRQATTVLGSVHYFSPEQARGGPTDAKSDIYSLGVVMYEMLTGKLPFEGDSPVSVALKHLREPFVEPRQLNRDIPQSVENIVLRCLVKEPEGRYPDMAAVMADLDAALQRPNEPKFVPSSGLDGKTIVVPAMGERLSEALKSAEVTGEEGASDAPASAKRPMARWKRASLITGIVVLSLAAIGLGGYAAIVLVTRLLTVPNVELPSVVGKPAAAAVATLEAAGFSRQQIQEKFEPNVKAASGIVYQQSPAGNTQVKKTRDITLYVSQGAPKVAVPDVTNEPLDQAKQALTSAGFSANNIAVQTETSTSVPSGDVISSDPAPGTQVPITSKITLTVSQQQYVTVPKLVGLTLQQAEAAIQAAGLTLGTVTPSDLADQNPLVSYAYPYIQGDRVPAGSTINLYVVPNPASLPPSNGTGNDTGNGTSGGTQNGSGNAAGADNGGANSAAGGNSVGPAGNATQPTAQPAPAPQPPGKSAPGQLKHKGH
ncbi:Stk1 family PASTA domain-containing Ser/Thr kinase [Alicyclobacillus mali]|uniref:non-specific serine/threonine protein kinase n=1 Tax=Alicyclobacillus mali (ex Roth et al. 2021) TaxID=1123961 RepID=A0ABS0F2T4_9BACL|nr:Stk1 family PASTA domain-containing Ser/Thr kinase [Alicyclobacillus mali (ex Roth et al. 2021)]MBF8377615.1 Stk1 family PASTA domain-containing Ser/Thr kinase [Alicyclobacillus mali (ex Roth et al. 2021)]MCL6488557.1 Stk1 family PASTA domain-containing Ser/Thr kinase [Alicyclobacillus mali (ex Roth et al. 2021)]